jgi:CDGSH-type Zn-finger protein
MPERDVPVLIVAYPNGPLLVRGEVEIRTPEGAAVPQRRRTVALCRCGRSTIKPYCDGTHKVIGFVTEPEGPDDQAR